MRHHKTRQTPKRQEASWASCLRLSKKSRPDDMRVRSGHIQGNFALRVCEPVRASARFGAKFCPQGDTRGKEFLSRVCGQKWVPPGAWRFCDTLRQEASWASCLGVLLLNTCYSVKTLRGRYRRMALTGPPARSVLPRSGMPAKAKRHSRRSRLRGPAAASAGVPAGSYPSRPAREDGRRLPSLS